MISENKSSLQNSKYNMASDCVCMCVFVDVGCACVKYLKLYTSTKIYICMREGIGLSWSPTYFLFLYIIETQKSFME